MSTTWCNWFQADFRGNTGKSKPVDTGCEFGINPINTRLNGQLLRLSTNEKYLGAVFDIKLNWRLNIKIWVRKAYIVFYAFKNLFVKKVALFGKGSMDVHSQSSPDPHLQIQCSILRWAESTIGWRLTRLKGERALALLELCDLLNGGPLRITALLSISRIYCIV